MKVALASTSVLALPTYRALKESKHEVIALITKSEQRSGRGLKIEENELAKSLVDERLLRIDGHEDLTQTLNELKPDLVIAISFGLLVKEDALQIPKHGWINLHFSLLPKYRGAAPVQRAILSGDSVTGITVFQLEKGMDTGPIFTTAKVEMLEKNSGVLLAELAQLGSSEVLRAIEMIETGRKPSPQLGEPSLAPKIESSETRINFNRSAKELLREIRAFSPRPGSWCEYQGKRIKIIQAEISPSYGNRAGEVLLLSPLTISTIDSAISIAHLQEAGKRVMSATEWVRGSRVKVGDLFE